MLQLDMGSTTQISNIYYQKNTVVQDKIVCHIIKIETKETECLRKTDHRINNSTAK